MWRRWFFCQRLSNKRLQKPINKGIPEFHSRNGVDSGIFFYALTVVSYTGIKQGETTTLLFSEIETRELLSIMNS